jgi:hypothetical protein
MMKKYSVFLLILMVSLLSACGPIYQTTYTYSPPSSQTGKMCVNQCLQTKNNCQQMCQLQDQNCRMQARQDAFYRYQQYRDEQTSRGEKNDRSIDSFDDSYSRCNHSCHCVSDFNICYENCGGVVQKNKVCTAFCN